MIAQRARSICIGDWTRNSEAVGESMGYRARRAQEGVMSSARARGRMVRRFGRKVGRMVKVLQGCDVLH